MFCYGICFPFFLAAVIMTPTRELALQIYRECKKFCKPLNLRAVCVYGGTGISEQVGISCNYLTIIILLKVKSDHRSKFSNLSNNYWKEEA